MRVYEPLPAAEPGAYPKMCYLNAQTRALDDGLRYAEGIAHPPDPKWPPVAHAWVLDADDFAIEVTWTEPGRRYEGFEVPITVVTGRPCRTIPGGFYLTDPRRGSPTVGDMPAKEVRQHG